MDRRLEIKKKSEYSTLYREIDNYNKRNDDNLKNNLLVSENCRPNCKMTMTDL